MKKIIIIFVFSILFGIVVTDGIRIVVQKMYEIPFEYIGIAYWGNVFWFRIIASLVGTLSGGFIIGSHLKEKAKLMAILRGGVVSLFWIAVLVFFSIFNGLPLKETILAISLIILSPLTAFLGWKWGKEYLGEFIKPKSILNIRWYHWIWILPFYLNKVIAIPIYNLLILWKIDAFLGDPSIFNIFGNLDLIILRIITFLVFAGIAMSIGYVYKQLAEEEKISHINKFGIFGSVLLLIVLYFLFLSY